MRFMSTPGHAATADILRDVADRLKDLDVGELQQEINAIQQEIQELNRLNQERGFLVQLRQLEAQRRAERANGINPRLRWSPDRDIQRALDELHRVLDPLQDQAINAEMARLQAALQQLNRQIQERQHVFGLKQMLTQDTQAALGVPFVQQGVGIQFGLPQFQIATNAVLPQRIQRVDAETKRRAILEVMAGQPGRKWKPVEIRAALAEKGMQNIDEGTPVRNLLWKMHQDGLIERPSSGFYSLPAPGAADGSNVQRSE